jgi:hypothetical protein
LGFTPEKIRTVLLAAAGHLPEPHLAVARLAEPAL